MTDTAAPRHRSMLVRVDESRVLPPGLKDLPPAIAKANQAAREAIARRDETRDRHTELVQQANAAPDFDRIAAAAAADVGEAPPPATAPKKRAEAEEAQRAAEAAIEAGRRRVWELYDAVEAHHQEYVASRQKLAEATAKPLSSAVVELLDLVIAFRASNEVYRLARDWFNNPKDAALSGNSDPGRPLRREFEKALARQRELGTQRRAEAYVYNEIPDLLAAIALHLERELGP